MMQRSLIANQAGDGSGGVFSLVALEIALTYFGGCLPLDAQVQHSCGADGYRVVAQSWDPILKRGWDSRQECAHPDRPLRLAATVMQQSAADGTAPNTLKIIDKGLATEPPDGGSSLLVKAGDVVRLWMQGASVRIEMSGVVECSAHHGERVMVQVTRHDDEAGLSVQRIAGSVSGAGEVEMER